MPSFVNIGAYIETARWSTPGRRSAPARRSASPVHLSGGAGIGGVLEPLQAPPRSSRTAASSGPARRSSRRHRPRGRGAVDGHVHPRLDPDRRSRDRRGVPWVSAAVLGGGAGLVCPASPPTGGPSLASCAVIVKSVDAQTRSKTSASTNCCATDVPALERSKSVNKILPMDWVYLFNSFRRPHRPADVLDRHGRGDGRRGFRPLHRRADPGRPSERHRRSRFHLSGIRRRRQARPGPQHAAVV